MSARGREWLFIFQVFANFAVLTLLIVFVVFAAGANAQRDQEQQAQSLRVTCQIAQTNRATLEALDDISRSLGIPTRFTIPEVPTECDGS